MKNWNFAGQPSIVYRFKLSRSSQSFDTMWLDKSGLGIAIHTVLFINNPWNCVTDFLQLVNEAYSTLKNPESRSEYNQTLKISNQGFAVKSNMLWHRSADYKSPYNQQEDLSCTEGTKIQTFLSYDNLIPQPVWWLPDSRIIRYNL